MAQSSHVLSVHKKRDPPRQFPLADNGIRLIGRPQICLAVSPNTSDPCDDRNPVKEKLNERKRNRFSESDAGAGGREAEAVWSKNSCGAGIELEQSSEPLAALNGVAALFGFIGSIREKKVVAFALMIAFTVIMRAELG